MDQKNQDELMKKIFNLLSKAFKTAMQTIKEEISAEVKKEVKATLTKPIVKKPSLHKPKNYDKFRVSNLETGTQKILNKRILAKAAFDQLVSSNPEGYTLQELRKILPIGKRTFLEVQEVKRRNLVTRYYMDSPYVTSDQKEIVFTSEWSIDTITLLQEQVATNEIIFKLKIEKAA